MLASVKTGKTRSRNVQLSAEVADRAGHMLLGEPLDGAGNRISGGLSAVYAGAHFVTPLGFRRLRSGFQTNADRAARKVR